MGSKYNLSIQTNPNPNPNPYHLSIPMSKKDDALKWLAGYYCSPIVSHRDDHVVVSRPNHRLGTEALIELLKFLLPNTPTRQFIIECFGMKMGTNDAQWIHSLILDAQRKVPIKRNHDMFQGHLKVKLDVAFNIKPMDSLQNITSFNLLQVRKKQFEEVFGRGFDFRQRPLLVNFFVASLTETSFFGRSNAQSLPGGINLDARPSARGMSMRTDWRRPLLNVKGYNKNHHLNKAASGSQFTKVPENFIGYRRMADAMQNILQMLEACPELVEVVRFEFSIMPTDSWIHHNEQSTNYINKAVSYAKRVLDHLKQVVLVVEVPMPYVIRSHKLFQANVSSYFKGQRDSTQVHKRHKFLLAMMANSLGIWINTMDLVTRKSPSDSVMAWVKFFAKMNGHMTLGEGQWIEGHQMQLLHKVVPPVRAPVFSQDIDLEELESPPEYHVLMFNPQAMGTLHAGHVRSEMVPPPQPLAPDDYRWMDKRMGKMVSMRRDYNNIIVPKVVQRLDVSEELVKRIARDGPQSLEEDKIIYALLAVAGEQDTPPVRALAMEDVFNWSYGVGKVKMSLHDAQIMRWYGTRHEKGYTAREHLVPVSPDDLGGQEERESVEQYVLKKRAYQRMRAYNLRVLNNYLVLRYCHDEKIGVRQAVDREVREQKIEDEKAILRFRDQYRNQNDGDDAPQQPFLFQKVEQFMEFEDSGVLPDTVEVEQDDVVFPTGGDEDDDEDGLGMVTDEDTAVEDPTDIVSERTLDDIMKYALIKHYPKMRGREYGVLHKHSRGFAFVGRSMREVALQIEIHHKESWRDAVQSKAEGETPNEYPEDED